MPNPFRGTFEIKLGEKTYTVLPSFDFCVEFEDLTGRYVPDAHQELFEGRTSIKLIVSAIYCGIKANAMAVQGDYPTFRVVGELCRQEGFGTLRFDALKLLSFSMLPHERVEELQRESQDAEEQGKKKAESSELTGGDSSES